MDQSALIAERGVTPDQNVVCDRLPEDLDLEHVRDDFLRFAVDVRVDERDIVIAGDDVAERRETLFYPLERDGVRERVAEVLEFLVRRPYRYEQSVSVSGR